jgi:hypothetical protein
MFLRFNTAHLINKYFYFLRGIKMNSLLNKLFFVFFLLITPILNAQYLINNFNGIPIIASVPWDASDYHLDSVKSMGVDFIIATQLTETRLNEITNRGLKALPLQSTVLYNYIIKYSEGAYTKWEAEGTPLGKGDAKLKYNPNIGATFNTGGRQGVVTQEGAGYDTLISGPGYMQERRYWRIDTGYVYYTANFNMLLTNAIPPESGNPNDTICILQVTDSKIVGPPSEPYQDSVIFVKDTALLRSDFTPGVWQSFDFIYNFYTEESDVQQPSSFQLSNYTFQNYQSNDPSNKDLADFVQFKIIWKGDQYSRLYVDNIIVSDQKGKDIITLPAAKQNIVTQATQSFPNTNLDTSVAAWFAIDEPETIDNYEPMRVIDSLLKANSNGKRGIWVSFPSSWNGKYGDSNLGAQGVYKSNEFIQRTGITPHQNNHPLFDAPYRPPEYQDYKERNIRVLADSIMNRVNDWDSTFSMTLLCGRVEEASLFHDPEPYEMLYEANLKLLYGAKSLSLYRYFGRDNDPTFTGLVNYANGVYTYTEKYRMVKNTLSPRLKGLFGKKLKSLKQTEQTLSVYCSLNNNIGFIKSILLYEDSPPPSGPIFEIGIFNDPQASQKKYCMLLKRYYPDSTHNTFTVVFKDLSGYTNWKYIDYRDTTTYTLKSNSNAEATSDSIHIERGDAAFISLYPVVLYGGSLAYNDTIKTNTTLIDNMTINNSIKLFIKAGKFYTIQDTVTLLGAGQTPNWGFITGDGYLDVASGGEVLIYSWANSLFKGKSNNHPKLFWGKFSDSSLNSYKIYRKKETPGFVLIASLSASTRSYIDTTVTVIDGFSQGNEVEAEYYVRAVYNNFRSYSNSNTIMYKRVEGSSQEKQNTGLTLEDFTYALEQNYPNPFNPVTTIKFDILKDGLVSLEIFDILGRRITTLVNENRTAGSYEQTFDASSLASGVYVYKLQAGDFISSKKMILLK